MQRPRPCPRRLLLLGLCLGLAIAGDCLPHHPADDQEIVMVEEVVRFAAHASESNATAALLTLMEEEEEHEEAAAGGASHSDETDIMDDLIVPLQRAAPPATTQRSVIDLLTSDEEASLDSATSGEEAPSATNKNVAEGAPTMTAAVEVPLKTPPVDLSDFLELIPLAEVRSIAATYYRSDAEVQRAYAYLQSRDFASLRQHILNAPDMITFLGFLNGTGLDVVGTLRKIVQLTLSREAVLGGGSGSLPPPTEGRQAVAAAFGNEIEKRSTTPMPTTTPAELNGLHGLVDSVLDILPQDMILSTFFDKLESDEPFAQLVDSIGTPKFAKILSDMQNSAALRNLIFTLHNNGIYITRIVDSLKAYFFLGTF